MDNFETEDEIWFVFPLKSSGEKSIAYNDAVEEELLIWEIPIYRDISTRITSSILIPNKKSSGDLFIHVSAIL